MTKGVARRLARTLRIKSKRSFAVLKKINGTHIKVGLVAAILFLSAYAENAEVKRSSRFGPFQL
jgi:hypothetical protein